MLAEGTSELQVTDDDGNVLGTASLESIARLIAPEEEASRA
jgi:hypothetical protein